MADALAGVCDGGTLSILDLAHYCEITGAKVILIAINSGDLAVLYINLVSLSFNWTEFTLLRKELIETLVKLKSQKMSHILSTLSQGIQI